jgi:hypothetical protein
MTPETYAEPKRSGPGTKTFVCRFLCTVLVASPLVNYVSTVIGGGGGNAYLFFLLLVLAPIAGLALIANSVFCIVRYPNRASFKVNLIFMLVGMISFLEVWLFLPKFRM